MKYIQLFALCLICAVGLASAQAQQKKAESSVLKKEARISMQEAEKAALAKEPGTIKSKELEKEKGKLIYSFDIRTKSGVHEVNIDAITGEVVEDSVESKADEAKEKQQDAKYHHGKKNPTPPTPPQ